MKKPQLKVLKEAFSIFRLPASEKIPENVYQSVFYWIGKTDDELSIVCETRIRIPAPKEHSGWSCIKALGPIDFSVVGLLADISGALAKAKISIFAISTFDTDYVLMQSVSLDNAISVLKKAGYTFTK